jgi:hypothetical protein
MKSEFKAPKPSLHAILGEIRDALRAVVSKPAPEHKAPLVNVAAPIVNVPAVKAPEVKVTLPAQPPRWKRLKFTVHRNEAGQTSEIIVTVLE